MGYYATIYFIKGPPKNLARDGDKPSKLFRIMKIKLGVPLWKRQIMNTLFSSKLKFQPLKIGQKSLLQIDQIKNSSNFARRELVFDSWNLSNLKLESNLGCFFNAI